MLATIKGQMAILDRDRNTPLKDKVQEMLQIACNRFDLEMGVFARVEGNKYIVMQMHQDTPTSIKPGDKLDLGSTLCMLVCATRDTVCQADVRNSEWSDHPAYCNSLLRAYFGTPIIINGDMFGTLEFSSSRPVPEASVSSVCKAIRLMGGWLNEKLLKDPTSRHLCQQICGNHQWLCSNPLPSCVDCKKDQPQAISLLKT